MSGFSHVRFVSVPSEGSRICSQSVGLQGRVVWFCQTSKNFKNYGSGKTYSIVFVCFYVVCVFTGFDHSKMANLGFRTYSNTFLDISGTSKKSTKSGTLDPWFITETLQTNTRKIQNHLKWIILHIIELWISKMLEIFEKAGTGKWWRFV